VQFQVRDAILGGISTCSVWYLIVERTRSQIELARWRAVNGPHLVALVRAGARFQKGKLVERPDNSEGDQQVA
jgi:hypothetical protein